MMGKRVKYAAHSVISPDPNISMDEIRIPMVLLIVLHPVTCFYNLFDRFLLLV